MCCFHTFYEYTYTPPPPPFPHLSPFTESRVHRVATWLLLETFWLHGQDFKDTAARDFWTVILARAGV